MPGLCFAGLCFLVLSCAGLTRTNIQSTPFRVDNLVGWRGQTDSLSGINSPGCSTVPSLDVVRSGFQVAQQHNTYTAARTVLALALLPLPRPTASKFGLFHLIVSLQSPPPPSGNQKAATEASRDLESSGEYRGQSRAQGSRNKGQVQHLIRRLDRSLGKDSTADHAVAFALHTPCCPPPRQTSQP